MHFIMNHAITIAGAGIGLGSAIAGGKSVRLSVGLAVIGLSLLLAMTGVAGKFL
jgi:hypothetical protein